MTDNDRIDKVLYALNSSKVGRIDIKDFFQKDLKDTDLVSYQRIIIYLEEKNYARRRRGQPCLVEILPDGREIVESGGFLKHLEKTQSEKAEAEIQEKIKLELDNHNLLMAKFYYKYRWLPFLLSVIAIILSVLALICSR